MQNYVGCNLKPRKHSGQPVDVIFGRVGINMLGFRRLNEVDFLTLGTNGFCNIYNAWKTLQDVLSLSKI